MTTLEWYQISFLLAVAFGLISFYRCTKLQKVLKDVIASEEPLKRECEVLREELGRKLEDIAKEIDIRIMDALVEDNIKTGTPFVGQQVKDGINTNTYIGNGVWSKTLLHETNDDFLVEVKEK